MKNDSFTDTMMSKNENLLREWIDLHGKTRKPVSPIFFLDKEVEKEWSNIRSTILEGGNKNEQESNKTTQR